MTDIFISHAVADKALADKFVTFLKEAIGVPARSIFVSSIPGQGIPLGYDFNEYMKSQIQSPKLVILLITPRYLESWFCLMELGATWVKSHQALPIVVPPIKFDVISSTLGLKQGWSLDDHTKLIDLREMIRNSGITLEPRTDHDWDRKRTAWKADLARLLKNLAPATSVPASEVEALNAELEATRKELAELQEEFAEANETIDQLKAAKDPAAVKAITAPKGAVDAGRQFSELMNAVSEARPRVSIWFYRNMLLDLYDKAAAVDWMDRDQKSDAEAAVQYKMMERDVPHKYLWGTPKMQRIANAVRDVEQFLASEEAADLVRERTAAGGSMETDDLQFWEENLKV